MRTNKQIVKGTQTTGTVTSGLLNPEQSRQFLKQTFDATTLGGLVRHELRHAKTGEIDKIGIARRILRKKTEDTDDAYRANATFSKVEYSTTAVRLPWEITEETLRENIEGQGLEATITNLMTTQLGLDLVDLYINGDEDTPEKDGSDNPTPDYDFLKINNGWLKQIASLGHVVDRSAANSGEMSIDVYFDAVMAMPNKYNNGQLRWVMSPRRKQEWDRYLLDKIISVGGGVTDRIMNNPASIPTVEETSLSDDKIILTDPKNLIVVNTYDVKVRKTTEGKEAIMQDKRFYVTHLDFDPVIEETDATVLITGLKNLV